MNFQGDEYRMKNVEMTLSIFFVVECSFQQSMRHHRVFIMVDWAFVNANEF